MKKIKLYVDLEVSLKIYIIETWAINSFCSQFLPDIQIQNVNEYSDKLALNINDINNFFWL